MGILSPLTFHACDGHAAQLVSLLFYNVVQILENLVLARMGMTRTLQ